MNKIWVVYFVEYANDNTEFEIYAKCPKIFSTEKKAHIYAVNSLIYIISSVYLQHLSADENEDIDDENKWFENKYYPIEYNDNFIKKLINHKVLTQFEYIKRKYDCYISCVELDEKADYNDLL